MDSVQHFTYAIKSMSTKADDLLTILSHNNGKIITSFGFKCGSIVIEQTISYRLLIISGYR
jgi:hypothetical protein